MPGKVPEAQPAWLSCQAKQSMGSELPRRSTATSGQQSLQESPGCQPLPRSLHMGMESRAFSMSPPPSNLSSLNMIHERAALKLGNIPPPRFPKVPTS